MYTNHRSYSVRHPSLYGGNVSSAPFATPYPAQPYPAQPYPAQPYPAHGHVPMAMGAYGPGYAPAPTYATEIRVPSGDGMPSLSDAFNQMNLGGRPAPSLDPRRTSHAPRRAPDRYALHQAVLNKDVEGARALVQAGLRPNVLDQNRQSPLDLLDSLSYSSSRTAKLRAALLESGNPTAPAGYVKPEALHGTPWGLEILRSKSLKGGVNDPKGSNQSRQGAVFFSDRTPEFTTDKTTRGNLREKARAYSFGDEEQSTSASNRSKQYRMLQALDGLMLRQERLNLSGGRIEVNVASMRDADAHLKSSLQSILTQNGGQFRDLSRESLRDVGYEVALPREITVLARGGREYRTYSGRELTHLYGRLIGEMMADCEGGKAPLLGLINKGKVVPMVFGFEKVTGLKSHSIEWDGGVFGQYSYQTQSHPLGGSSRGGKLKEIELHDLKDLATMVLGCLAEGVRVPADVVIRLSPPADKKERTGSRARYLTSEQFSGFASNLVDELARSQKRTLGEMMSSLEDAPISRLQDLNDYVRHIRLETLIPERGW